MRDRDPNRGTNANHENRPEGAANDFESPNRAAEVFADPVGYLAALGITAELVTIADSGVSLPAAA